jgi:hypothetical protein
LLINSVKKENNNNNNNNKNSFNFSIFKLNWPMYIKIVTTIIFSRYTRVTYNKGIVDCHHLSLTEDNTNFNFTSITKSTKQFTITKPKRIVSCN